jgi:hypothetical protein
VFTESFTAGFALPGDFELDAVTQALSDYEQLTTDSPDERSSNDNDHQPQR